jgi:hypothetical protein
MAGPEDFLREIARIESDIEELLEYRDEIRAHNRAARGWARCKSSLRLLLVSKQIEQHLRYLRLQRELAHESYQSLKNAEHTDPYRRY